MKNLFKPSHKKSIFRFFPAVILGGVFGLGLWIVLLLINNTILVKEANGVVVALKHESGTKVSPEVNKADTIDLYEAEILINGVYGRVNLSKGEYQSLNHRDSVHCIFSISPGSNIAIIKSLKKI